MRLPPVTLVLALVASASASVACGDCGGFLECSGELGAICNGPPTPQCTGDIDCQIFDAAGGNNHRCVRPNDTCPGDETCVIGTGIGDEQGVFCLPPIESPCAEQSNGAGAPLVVAEAVSIGGIRTRFCADPAVRCDTTQCVFP